MKMKWSVKSSILQYQAALIGHILLIVLCAATLGFGKASTLLLQYLLYAVILWAILKAGFCISRIVKPVELICVDFHKLIDKTSLLSLGEIPWHMVEEVKMMPRGKQTVICLYGEDLKSLVKKKAFPLRLVIYLNNRLGYGFHMIKPLYADVELQKLYQVIERKGR